MAAMLRQALSLPAVRTSRGLREGGARDRDLGFRGITLGQCEDGGKGETAGREASEDMTAVVQAGKDTAGNALAKENSICKTRK